MTHRLLSAAERLTDSLLWPAAPEVDRAECVPDEHLVALGEAGLYGVEAAEDLVAADRWLIIETLASGCMSTTFVWIQHHTAVRALMATENVDLRSEWLDGLLAGKRRAGIAIGGVRPPVPSLSAARLDGGWSFTGSVPWVTGWGVVDIVLMGAAAQPDLEVWALVPARDGDGMRPHRRRLAAVDAACTVWLELDGLFVPDHMVTSVDAARRPDPADPGLRSNASLALGVTRRVTVLIGPSPLDAELDVVRRRLDETDRAEDRPGLAAARADAAELALRAAAVLTVQTGSRAVDVDGPAQRLTREAQFTAVFGSRPAMKAKLLELLER